MIVNSVRTVSTYNTTLQSKGFNAFRLEEACKAPRVYSRSDFYKICMTSGKSRIHYADRSFETDGVILFFGNPHIPYSWETISTSNVGYTCLFSEEFLRLSERSESLQQSPFFRIGGTPILHITAEQREYLNTIFCKMIEEQSTDYTFKDDLIRDYIHLIIHEALKLQPSGNFDKRKNAGGRLTAVFLELLERQFPIESVSKPLKLRSAADYAERLGIHVNHLNRTVKEMTGKSTTSHITERIVSEAKALLQHTNWAVSDIAYALGFEYPSYFNNYFKRMTGMNPTTFRNG